MIKKRKYGSARARQLRANGRLLFVVAGFLTLFTLMMVAGSGGADLSIHGPGAGAVVAVVALAVACLRLAGWAEAKWHLTQTRLAQHQAALSARVARTRAEAARAAAPTASVYTPPKPHRPAVVPEPATERPEPHPVNPVSPRPAQVIEGELVER
jgi:hypothetical protein